MGFEARQRLPKVADLSERLFLPCYSSNASTKIFELLRLELQSLYEVAVCPVSLRLLHVLIIGCQDLLFRALNGIGNAL